MFVARSLVDITTGVGAFWATTSSRAEDHKGALLGASRAISITSTPRAESAEAHLRACISVALPSDLLELSILTVLATVLGLDVLDEPSRLDTSTTIITALLPLSHATTAINRTRRGAVACCCVRCLVAVWARLTTESFLVGDGESAPSHAVATSGGALTES